MKEQKLSESFDLQKLRKLEGLTISDLSKITGASRTTIYSLENGGPVKDETIVQMASALLKSRRCERTQSDLERLLSTFRHSDLAQSANASVHDLHRIAREHMQTDTYFSIDEYRKMISLCEELIECFHTRIQEWSKIERDFE
ncbi:helix-turn-helix domain-containing protein [Nioella sp. MMSF_3534]|uniref:helix-turn-helix domain-containing protein n=1 Tax=Nioella sp. MMSF_3534 TaxID=3046720 RepID=UPI003532111E